MSKACSTTKDRIAATQRSWLRRAYSSYWFERIVFVLGSILIFVSEQVVNDRVESAKDDVSYLDGAIQKIDYFAAARKNSLAEYNRSVAMKPQIRELVAQNAFDLFAETDQLLALLRAVVEHDGRGEVLSVLEAKNTRRAKAADELRNGDAEALVARVNEITADHEKNAEAISARLALKRIQAVLDEIRWKRWLKASRLSGTLLIAGAFLLRELKDFRRRRDESKGALSNRAA